MRFVNLVLFSIVASGAQLSSGNATSNGVSLSFDTRLEPATPPIRSHGGGTFTQDNIIKRHICNFDNHTYFGYDLAAEPIDGGRYRLRFSPLTITPQKMHEIFDKVSNWTPLPLPGGAASMEVRAGETVALDLFVNPSTGQKVTDYLTINGSSSRRSEIAGPARDFTPSDAVIDLSAPQVIVDGRTVHEDRGGISGEALWMDLPGHGRFVFSLVPRFDLGMQKLGEIRGTSMTWRLGGHEYRITAKKPITTGSSAYNLYVFLVPRTVESFSMSAGPKPDDPIHHK